MAIYSIDTETTTWDRAAPHFFVTQVGIVGVDNPERTSWYVKSKHVDSIQPDVVGVTGLTREFLNEVGKDPAEVISLTWDIVKDGTVAAYNWPFDMAVLDKSAAECGVDAKFSSLPYIDMYRVVKEFYDEGEWTENGSCLPNMKLGTAYHGIVPEAEAAALARSGGGAHDAVYDADMVVGLVRAFMAAGLTADEMITLSRTEFVPRVCPFGAHKGKKWSDIPESYLLWMAKNAVAGDTGLELAVLQELERRGALS